MFALRVVGFIVAVVVLVLAAVVIRLINGKYYGEGMFTVTEIINEGDTDERKLKGDYVTGKKRFKGVEVTPSVHTVCEVGNTFDMYHCYVGLQCIYTLGRKRTESVPMVTK